MSTFERQNNFHANLDRSPFGTGAPLSSNVTEFTQLFFPASKVTPEFVKEFERSWQSFQTIMQEGVKGLHEIVKGWVLEEQEHESVQGEKATCFFALVGWDSLEHHQRAQQSEAFAKAAPLVVSLASGYDIVGAHRTVLEERHCEN